MTEPSPRRLPTLLLAGTFTALGVAAAGQLYLLLNTEGQAISFPQALQRQLPAWLFWLAAAPAILWLGRRLPLDQGLSPARLLPHLGAGLGFAALHSLLIATLYRWFDPLGPHTEPLGTLFRGNFTGRAVSDLLVYAALLAAGYAVDYHDRFQARALHAAQLETELARAELQSLRMQLQPHFLFNTLNTIAVLTESRPGAAREMLTQLGDLLRAGLASAGAQEVRLAEEVELLTSYLGIEQTRFSDRLRVSLALDPATLQAWVPNLVLQPLVENAIRYAIAPRATAGTITVASAVEEGRLTLTVTDDGPGYGRAPVAPGQGLGLGNTRARLARLYGPAATVDIGERPGGGTVVTLRLPFHAGEVPAGG